MGMEPKHGDYFRAPQHLTQSQQQQYLARDEDLRRKYENGRCDTVIEFPDELKSTIALPAITRRIVNELIDRQLEGWTLERMRATKILDFNDWSVQLV